MSTRLRHLACGLAVAALAPLGQASAQTSRQTYTIEPSLTERELRVDGFLNEEAWESAPMIDEFVQQEPMIGEPATERTEVRVLYDSRHLYVGVRAFDSNPAGIVATEMRRDSDRLLDEDSFQIILDTFNDSRNGYMFVTSPLGAKLEQQISEEGEGNNKGNGVNLNVNKNWDGVWDVAAHITEDGWTAEISIPMATVRFAKRDVQTWGINFMRNIRRKNEQVFWSPIPKSYALQRVSLAGSLIGLRSLSQGMDLKLKPFVFSGVRDTRTSITQATSFLRDGGLDVKYGVTSGLNLDVTYRTDFAQVEVDEQQLNLTRFGVFFPEKRDFFLENAGFFNVGTGNVFSGANVETDLFFSRRIGLSDTGQPVPIIGGARLTGKAGPHSIGLFDIQTESAFGNTGDNFFVGRYSHDILRRSRVGAMVINKESTGGSSHFNRTANADVNLALGRSLQLTSYIAKTWSPDRRGDDMAFFGRSQYRSEKWFWWLQHLNVQDNFNPEVGFAQRPGGFGITKGYFARTPRPGRWHIRVLEPGVMGHYLTDQQGRMTGRMARGEFKMTFDDDSMAVVLYERDLDVVDEAYRIPSSTITIPSGRYQFDDLFMQWTSNPARRLYGSMRVRPSLQGYYGGDRLELFGKAGVRATTQVATEFSLQRIALRLPYGDFTVNLAIARVDYALSPRMTIRSLTQYNSSTHEITSSIRYNFIYRPGSDLYLVYNDLQQDRLAGYQYRPGDRQLVLKFTYLLSE